MKAKPLDIRWALGPTVDRYLKWRCVRLWIDRVILSDPSIREKTLIQIEFRLSQKKPQDEYHASDINVHHAYPTGRLPFISKCIKH